MDFLGGDVVAFVLVFDFLITTGAVFDLTFSTAGAAVFASILPTTGAEVEESAAVRRAKSTFFKPVVSKSRFLSSSLSSLTVIFLAVAMVTLVVSLRFRFEGILRGGYLLFCLW